MRRTLSLYLSILLALSSALFLVACRQPAGRGSRPQARIAVTIPAQRYFVQSIGDTLFDIECLVPKGKNPETYDPSTRDMARIARCAAYLYVGDLGFEQMSMERIQTAYPAMRLFNMSAPSGIDSDCCSSEHTHRVDPHYWLSVSGGHKLTEATKKALTEIQPEHADKFEANAQKLHTRIDSINNVISYMLKGDVPRAFVIYHPSLTYFARDFGLQQLVVEENGKEPSPLHLQNLIDRARHLGVRVVFLQKEFNRQSVEQIATMLEAELVEIDPLADNWSREMFRAAEAICRK